MLEVGLIVDFHTHIFPPHIVRHRERYLERDAWLRQLYANPRAPMATAESLIACLDQYRIDAAVALNFGWSDPILCAETNDYLLQAARDYPGRILPFCVVQPLSGEEAAKEIERCAKAGAKGVGELMPDGQGFALDDPTVLGPVVEAAEALNLPILTHASEPVGHTYPGKGRTTPDVLYRFITRFPNLQIVLSHWGGGLPLYGVFKGLQEHLANVYFDSAASPFLYRPEIFRYAAEIVGPTHILFGTDYPLITPDRLVHQIRTSGLTPDHQQLILGENARRLLRLPEPLQG